ncbi:hypothetical protein O6H91_16G032700 [Diphasiastrum complanatum]|uniref:Uncharacterized protein n=1 Tax=Diphasiastrum complanatum TaxID=34168 RepID=A0ACC2BB70_DIPCM|nr:hypothetical protein O6H91_Y483300 [Diphasiastrum complanatum]KAJ7527022.1 hypothetical protein O6H91_16G032700 [Diphasiastrum complanatum]
MDKRRLGRMVTIKRCATVVSNYQESMEQQAGCGRNCLGGCCVLGAKLPVFKFVSRCSAKHQQVHVFHGDKTAETAELEDCEDCELMIHDQSNSFLDNLVLAQWEDRTSRGLFRYDVTACETKVLPGKFGFIAQLNEGRHSKKRPTEFRVDQVLQPFDPAKFNFTKVGQEELLFCFEESEDGRSRYFDAATVKGSPNVVVINVSPIEYGHVLLVPKVLDHLPQKLEPETFLLALNFAVEMDNPYFRLGYNSLGAFATINHLHFQAYYLAAPFAVERAPVSALFKEQGGVGIFELAEYPVRGLVFELGRSLEQLADLVVQVCKQLQDYNIPFNVLIADRGTRIFLFPQCYAAKQARGEVDQEYLDTQVNPAVWEISGHIVLKRKEDYEMASEDYAWKLLAEVSLPEAAFNNIKLLCLELGQGNADCHKIHKDTTLADEAGTLLGKQSISIAFHGLSNGSMKVESDYTADIEKSKEICMQS